MKRFVSALAVLLILGSFPGAAYAQEPDQVILKSVIQREIEVINEAGEKEIRLVEAGNAIPGDELILTVTYTNGGAEPAENVVLVNPVPEHTEYLDQTAAGQNTSVTFSVDGGKTYDLPENLRIMGEDGRSRMARAGEYTHIRWMRDGSLSPGESGAVFFRVRLR